MIVFKHQKGAEVYTKKILEKLNSTDFVNDALTVTSFDQEYTEPVWITGFEIVEALINAEDTKISVGFYRQNWWSWKFAPVNAYVDYTGKNIFLNTRQLYRSEEDIEETIWHELVHVSDSLNTNAIYWHGDNKLAGKDRTAPVKFAKWAANWKPKAPRC